MNKLFSYTVIIPFLIVCTLPTTYAQGILVERVEPPNWWVGMNNENLQLLVYGENISLASVDIHYEGIEIESILKLESPNYLFVNLRINEQAQPGSFDILFKKDEEEVTYNYELGQKAVLSNVDSRIDGSDVIYLITPDRFANGDPSNDSTGDTIEKADRSDSHGRHGGDLKGIIDRLDYIEELGVTTIWLNPVMENDQPKYSYHGYGISDFYNTDSRFGNNYDYIALVKESHERGMKVIMDQVFNHSGAGHWWMNDLPSKDWINQWESYTQTSFTNLTASDPYASDWDYEKYIKGWFDINLPDLNLEHPFLATYMIQNSIWWVETANLDGVRMDTYPYPEKEVMKRWMQEIRSEYPNLFVVAETWERKASSLSYWNSKGPNTDGYNPLTNSTSDYPLYYAILEAFGSEKNTYKLFETLAEDFVYGTPFFNKTFNGNHDVARLYNQLNKDLDAVKLSMAFVLTTRGIPQIYYGDELAFEGTKPDGVLRKDFPGGWESDERNAFTQEGRTPHEQEMYEYVQKILQWRKNASEIHEGRLKHFQPVDNVYVYFRYTEENSSMIILNNSDTNYNSYSLERYQEGIEGFQQGMDIHTGNFLPSLESISLEAGSARIIQLQR